MPKTFAVIGDPIGHSLSPDIHGAAFRELGLDCSYIAYRIPRGELEGGIAALKKIGVAGFNVTVPHKVAVMGHLDRTDESCSAVGAANTVSSAGGMLKGYNTDVDGFLDPFKKRGLPVRGSSVLLLGAGGAARAIVAAFAKERAGRITVANRTPAGAEELSEFSARLGLDAEPAGLDRVGGAGGYDIIVNATSLGMENEPIPVPLDGIGGGTTVCDIVYRPVQTDLLRRAKAAGATVIYGYEMLLGQAARAFEIWHGVRAPYGAMKRALLGGA